MGYSNPLHPCFAYSFAVAITTMEIATFLLKIATIEKSNIWRALKNMQENILSKLDSIEQRLVEQNLLQKEIINFSEACLYLDLSSSHLYKLTSANAIPCYCPQGKKLYFRRTELDLWLTSHRNASTNEIEQKAANYIVKRGRTKR